MMQIYKKTRLYNTPLKNNPFCKVQSLGIARENGIINHTNITRGPWILHELFLYFV